MKRTLCVVVVSSAFFLLAGCGAKPPVKPEPQIVECQWPDDYESNKPAPGWICALEDESAITGIGSVDGGAVMSRDRNLMRKTAMARGRAEIASNIRAYVESALNESTTVTGMGDQQTVSTVTNSMLNEITAEDIQGARAVKQAVSPKGALYVLMRLDNGIVADIIQETVRKTFKEDTPMMDMANGKRLQDELTKKAEDLRSRRGQ